MAKPNTKQKPKSTPTKRIAKPKESKSSTGIKPFVFRTPDYKFLGDEPTWEVQPTPSERKIRLIKAFRWYGYYFQNKEAKEMIIQWLEANNRHAESKSVKATPDTYVPMSVAWTCRANLVGLELTEQELQTVNDGITNFLTLKLTVVSDSAPEEPKVTIQDRLKEKIIDCSSEIDGMFDDFIRAGAKMTADFKPISIFRSMNAPPQMISYISDIWKRELAEFEEVIKGKDKELAESYDKYSKIQMRSLVKFAEQVIADCSSYVQVKKSERKPRAKKAVSPEKLASKFKYLKEFPELKLKSEAPAKLVAATEAFLYDTAKRKLIYVVADSNAGSLTIKGSSIVGFDETLTVQKTLRKPADQIKQVIGGGKPAARKAFKEIKATDVKWSGRSNENLVILKAW